MSLALIQKMQHLLDDAGGPPLAPETRTFIQAAIDTTRREGIEADLASGWHTQQEICTRWKVGWSTVTAAKKRLAGKKGGEL
jgi:hypothetical protein